MPDLIAQGVEPQQRWRRSLPEGESVLLGRLTGTWAVPWDQHVSRRHARLLWSGKRLEVAKLPDTRNPIFLRGKEVDQFMIEPGEHTLRLGSDFHWWPVVDAGLPVVHAAIEGIRNAPAMYALTIVGPAAMLLDLWLAARRERNVMTTPAGAPVSLG